LIAHVGTLKAKAKTKTKERKGKKRSKIAFNKKCKIQLNVSFSRLLLALSVVLKLNFKFQILLQYFGSGFVTSFVAELRCECSKHFTDADSKMIVVKVFFSKKLILGGKSN
jgi:hypothetical protein